MRRGDGGGGEQLLVLVQAQGAHYQVWGGGEGGTRTHPTPPGLLAPLAHHCTGQGGCLADCACGNPGGRGGRRGATGRRVAALPTQPNQAPLPPPPPNRAGGPGATPGTADARAACSCAHACTAVPGAAGSKRHRGGSCGRQPRAAAPARHFLRPCSWRRRQPAVTASQQHSRILVRARRGSRRRAEGGGRAAGLIPLLRAERPAARGGGRAARPRRRHRGRPQCTGR